MTPSGILDTLIVRWSTAWRDAATSAVAAGIAWIIAVHLLGHPHPVFAAISAIICLSPGLPSHGRQAIGLMLGVATGIVIGEAALLLPDRLLHPEVLSLARLALAAFFAMLAAASFGLGAVVPIQSGVSAVLVLALGPSSAGIVRMEDVAVGVVVGLVVSQVILTPDPIGRIDAAASDLLRRLAKSFPECAGAVAGKDVPRSEVVLRAFAAAHESLIGLGAGIDAAKYAARWSVRGRLASRAVNEMTARYDRRAIRLYASSLLFAEAVANALRKNEAPAPGGLRDAILDVAERCAGLATGGRPARTHPPSPLAATGDWQGVVHHLQTVSEVLAALEALTSDTAAADRPPANGGANS